MPEGRDEKSLVIPGYFVYRGKDVGKNFLMEKLKLKDLPGLIRRFPKSPERLTFW